MRKMDRIVIPRTDARKSFVDPKPAWGRDASGELFIRCGGCGLCMGLGHEIAANGDVSPSLFHDSQECGWHVFGTLQDWDGGASQ